MIIKFDEFLLERMSFPISIKPYSEMIIDGCMERAKQYFKRKGRFANYTDAFEIEFDDIKQVIDEAEFVQYPIESISVDFGIRVSKNFVTPDILGLYHPLEENSEDLDIEAESFVIDSESGWIDKALHIELKIQIWLPKDAKSYQLDRSIKYITSTVHHELIHSYEDFIHGLITGPFYLMITDLKNFYDEVDGVDIYHLYLKHLMHNMYVMEKTEMNAYVGSAYEYPDDARKTVSNLLNFEAEPIYTRLMKDIETKYPTETGEKILETLNGIGKKLVEIYIKKCEEAGEEPKKNILKLRNKDFKQILEYFEPLYHKAAEYMTRKIVKMRYGKKQGDI